MNINKNLYLLRGVSGAGKTTAAENLYESLPNSYILALDDFWYDDQGNYNWEPDRFMDCIRWFYDTLDKDMKSGKYDNVIIHNTNTSEKDFKKVLLMAKKYGYKITSFIVENRHGSTNVHNVPEETLINQERKLRNNIKLR